MGLRGWQRAARNVQPSGRVYARCSVAKALQGRGARPRSPNETPDSGGALARRCPHAKFPQLCCPADWDARRHTWLPNADDLAFISSLMACGGCQRDGPASAPRSVHGQHGLEHFCQVGCVQCTDDLVGASPRPAANDEHDVLLLIGLALAVGTAASGLARIFHERTTG